MKAQSVSVSTLILALSSLPSFADGFVFVQTNQEKNSIIQYEKNDDGSLKMLREFPTGGKGTGGVRALLEGVAGPDPLASSGSLIMNQAEDMLFVVNAGDGSVSAFAVNGADEPKLIDTESTKGKVPNTLAYSDENKTLYVGHLLGPDHIRYMSFDNNDLVLQDDAQTINTEATTGRILTNIALSPDSERLVATVLIEPNADGSGPAPTGSHNLAVFNLDDDGAPGKATFSDAGGTGAFTTKFLDGESEKILTVFAVSNGFAINKIAEDGSVSKVGSIDADASKYAGKPLEYCWMSFSPDGEYVYASGFGTSDLTSLKIDDDKMSIAHQSVGRVEAISEFKAFAGVPSSGPVDSWASEDGYLYQIYGAAGKLGAFRMTEDGGLEEIATYDVPVNSTQGIAGL